MAEPEATEPIHLLWMAEVGCDFVLWDDTGAASGSLEHALPITPALRERILSWIREYYDYDLGRASIHPVEWEERGLALHRQLCEELGAGYDVEYRGPAFDLEGLEPGQRFGQAEDRASQ